MNRQITLTKNIDIGYIPPTPITKYFNCSYLAEVGQKLIAQASRYGFPISYAQEQDGKLIQNIFPIKKTETLQISTSSKIELGLHTEAAFHPYKPSAVLLLCLRGDTNAITTYAYVDEIIKHLTQSTIKTLSQPWYLTSIDESFRQNGEPDFEIPCSILRTILVYQQPVYELTYDEVAMKAINNQAGDALEEFKNAVKKSVHEIILEPGDLLVFNNKTTVHGRRLFEAKYDGTDRWLQRILAIDSAVPRQHKVGHTIVTKFGTKITAR